MNNVRERDGLTRRAGLLASLASLHAAARVGFGAAPGRHSRLSVEGYIWQQYAVRQKKSLGDVLDEVLPMARYAGFRNVELNTGFFAPEWKERALSLIRANALAMPSVYVGGGMHVDALAAETLARALETGEICKPFGCKAIVHNPDPKPAGGRKSDQELTVQALALNRMGRALHKANLQLRVHHHTPELVENAREWRHILKNTDPKYVTLCLDLDWLHQGGMDPVAILHEAAGRVTEIHARNSKDKLWLESFGEGDLNYSAIAAALRQLHLHPLVVVELAYRDNTLVTRPLQDDLRMGRIYAEKVFDATA